MIGMSSYCIKYYPSRTLHQYLKSNDSSNHGLQLLVFLLF